MNSESANQERRKNMQQKILIVEDDRNLAKAVSQILLGNDFDPDIAYDGLQGYEMAKKGEYDVILLDLMLPGLDGLEVCKKLKTDGITTPIIMVTARAAVNDKVAGFDAGADDYLPKPFSPRELMARIKAIIRRTSPSLNGHITIADIEFTPETGELCGPDDKFELSEKESLVFSELLKEPGAICSKMQLLEAGWPDFPDADANNVEAYISFLRKRLNFVGSNIKIKTLRKVGYRIELPR